MKTILVTGAAGFVGRNLCADLSRRPDLSLLTYDLTDAPDTLSGRALAADLIVHLAGVNRPEQASEFHAGNVGLTEALTAILHSARRVTPIIFASSTQALLDNPYGRSKLSAERVLENYREASGARVTIYRLPNLFGKWGRPNYNSAVATFCHNVARNLPITIHDPRVPLRLVYIDDLLQEFARAMEGHPTLENGYGVVPIVHETTVGAVADTIRSFKAGRAERSVPDLGDPLCRKLHSTYLSCLPERDFSYPLTVHADPRGSFTEFLRTPDRGQVSINVSRPGITKGNHWHHSKNEKFLVVSGHGVIRFRRVGTTEVLDYTVSGEIPTVVDIPPGYVHAITNLGSGDLVTLMWANESFDPAHPDAWPEEV